MFTDHGIKKIHKTSWNTTVDDSNEGIYVISSSSDPDKNLGTSLKPIFNEIQIKNWIQKLPDFQIDGLKPTLEVVKKRLEDFWLPDENVLYIGKAPKRKNGEAIGNRIREYYITELGNGSPHSGGQWIKTLKNLNSFFVYYGYTSSSDDIERKMLTSFMDGVSDETKRILRDKSLPLPFANIRYKPRNDKNHGMKNQRN
jgi:hypothetical protein